MRDIIVNGRFLTRQMTGVDRFAYEILLAVDELIDASDPFIRDLRFKIVVPPKSQISKRFRHILIEEFGFFRGHFWEQLDLSRVLDDDGILLSLCNTGPVFCRRQIVVIHDAGAVRIPGSYSRLFRLWYKILMPLLGLFAKRIVTVSEFSKRDISSAFGIRTNKIDVVSEGGEHIQRVNGDEGLVINKFGLSKGRYVLAVSSMAAHKNFRLLLSALARIPTPSFDVAVAGGSNPAVFTDLGLINSENVKRLGYVSDGELRILYENALCFVFPSLYEGFGIPPLEAMNCGCPVLATSAASIPEICGDAALYFDPENPDQLANLLIKISVDETSRIRLRDRGYVRAAKFSWKSGAYKLIEILRHIE